MNNRSLRHRRQLTRAAIGLIIAALFAWSISVVAGSAGHRTLRLLCSTIESYCQQWAAGFTEGTGIAVLMVRLPTGEALTRLSRPGGASEFDVWHGGPADNYVIADSRGLLAPYRSPQSAAIPDEYKDPNGAWTGTYLGVLGFCSNQRLLDQLGLAVPTSWDDLLDARLAHLVSVPNPVTSGTGFSWLFTQTLRLNSTEVFEYVAALDRNVLQYTNSGLSPAVVAGRGEAAVAVTFSQHCVQAIDSGMTDLRVSYPIEGSGIEIGPVAVLAGAPDKDAAHAYVDYALSAKAQSGFDGGLAKQLPTRPDVATDPRISGGHQLPSEPAAAANARSRLTRQFQQVVQR